MKTIHKSTTVAGPVGAIPASAFTLIELLVVVAIIGLLVALLLPALAGARRRALTTACLTRQKQWAMAWLEYADDNDGAIPREGYHDAGKVALNNWAHVVNPKAMNVWYNTLSNYMSIKSASAYARFEAQTDFYQRASLFQCPSAKFPSSGDPGNALFSMSMNSQMISPITLNRNISEIGPTSRTVMFLDNLLVGETPVVPEQARKNLGQPGSQADRFAGRRHGEGGNIVFVDGHAETLPGTKVVETEGYNRGFQILPERDVIWEVYP